MSRRRNPTLPDALPPRYLPGATYFFTVVTQGRRPIFGDHANVDLLRAAFANARGRFPFTVDAMVVLPDHLHTVWTMPEGDADFSLRWREIKSYFSRRCPTQWRASRNWSRRRKNEQAVWQRRFWEHAIRDQDDFDAHIDYIHFNPVRHGLVAEVAAWPHSSFHRYLREGLYPPSWGNDLTVPENVGHE